MRPTNLEHYSLNIHFAFIAVERLNMLLQFTFLFSSFQAYKCILVSLLCVSRIHRAEEPCNTVAKLKMAISRSSEDEQIAEV